MSFKLSLRAMTNLVEHQIWRHGFVCFRVEYLVFVLFVAFKYDVNFSRVFFFILWQYWNSRTNTSTPSEFSSWKNMNNWHGMYNPISQFGVTVYFRCSFTTSRSDLFGRAYKTPSNLLIIFHRICVEISLISPNQAKKFCAP